MKNNIKMMLKEASLKQDIPDLSEKIIANVDTSKIEPEIKSVKAPKKKFNFFPLMIAGVATAVLVLTLSITIGVMNNRGNNPVVPSNPVDPVIPQEPVVEYEEITLNTLEKFFSDFTVNDAPNMINIVNTFNNVSFDKPSNVTTGALSVEMENTIVNDVNLFINNIEDMLGYINTISTLNKSPLSDYKYLINVNNNNYIYKIYYNETLIEEKNVDKDNYKYRAELNGKIVIGNNNYNFTGEKRIKNSKLIYTTNIIIGENQNVDVQESFTINKDFTINYNQFEFKYNYHLNNVIKNFRITQRFDSNKNIRDIRFVANETEPCEFKMTIKPTDDNSILASIDSRNDQLSISLIETNYYCYTFKKSGNIYKR